MEQLDTVYVTANRGYEWWQLFGPPDKPVPVVRETTRPSPTSGSMPCTPPLAPESRIDKRYVFEQ